MLFWLRTCPACLPLNNYHFTGRLVSASASTWSCRLFSSSWVIPLDISWSAFDTLVSRASGAVMPYEEAVEMLKKSIKKMYGKKAPARFQIESSMLACHVWLFDFTDFLIHKLLIVRVTKSWRWTSMGSMPPSKVSWNARFQRRGHPSRLTKRPALSQINQCIAASKNLFKHWFDSWTYIASCCIAWQGSDAAGKKIAYGKGPRMFPEVQNADQFAKQVQAPCNNLDGNSLPVSAFVPGGRVPCGTSQYEKRGIAIQVPKVDMDKCTQCNKCSLICPHAAVRPFLMNNQELAKAPATFKDGSRAAIGGGVLDNYQYRIQVSPWDCTGCELCVRICPADALTLGPAEKVIEEEEENWNFAVTLPDRGDEIDKTTVKGSQFQKPYLEFSGACEGCGETPHVKLLTQLFGDRLVIANATGADDLDVLILLAIWACSISIDFMLLLFMFFPSSV